MSVSSSTTRTRPSWFTARSAAKPACSMAIRNEPVAETMPSPAAVRARWTPCARSVERRIHRGQAIDEPAGLRPDVVRPWLEEQAVRIGLDALAEDGALGREGERLIGAHERGGSQASDPIENVLSRLGGDLRGELVGRRRLASPDPCHHVDERSLEAAVRPGLH